MLGTFETGERGLRPERAARDRSVTRRALLALSVAVGLAGCDGGPLDGDWFFCTDIACAQLDSRGIRFRSDNTWVPLASVGDLSASAGTVCHFNINGTFAIEEDVLTLSGVSLSDLTSTGVDRPADPMVPAQTCTTDADCGGSPGTLCGASGLCESVGTSEPPPSTGTPSVQARFELLGDKMSLSSLDGSLTMILRGLESQDSLPCPSSFTGFGPTRTNTAPPNTGN